MSLEYSEESIWDHLDGHCTIGLYTMSQLTIHGELCLETKLLIEAEKRIPGLAGQGRLLAKQTPPALIRTSYQARIFSIPLYGSTTRARHICVLPSFADSYNSDQYVPPVHQAFVIDHAEAIFHRLVLNSIHGTIYLPSFVHDTEPDPHEKELNRIVENLAVSKSIQIIICKG